MHLVSFVCLSAWRCLTEKVRTLGQQSWGGAPPPLLRRGDAPPPPLQPPKLSHTPRGHTLAGGDPRVGDISDLLFPTTPL